MKTTRERILRTLLTFPGSTINDLAEAVGINGISIRHHLTALEAEDLVISSEERHGVGRPHLVYSLTDKGIEQFPTSYLRLTRRLIQQLRQRMTSREIETLFEEIGTEIAQSYSDKLKDKSLDERMRLLKPLLMNEGFIVDWEKKENGYALSSLSCPYYRIAPEHPEVCALDTALIKAFLETPVKVDSCIFQNADRCVYQIQTDQNGDENE